LPLPFKLWIRAERLKPPALRVLDVARKALHLVVVLVGLVLLAGVLGCAWLSSRINPRPPADG
jgi:hypothetical protein